MSNLSNIGFNVQGQEGFVALAKTILESGEHFVSPVGNYICLSDASGAQTWLQTNKSNKIVGMNPHFAGISRRKVCLVQKIQGSHSPLDGSFFCWANPAKANDPDSGEYPFVFDVPDFQTIGTINFPSDFEIQLSAFASEIRFFESEDDFLNQKDVPKMAPKSFIPSGLFYPGGKKREPFEALGILNGIVRECEEKINKLTGESFYWMLVETLGGNVDVVADKKSMPVPPKINGVVSGNFWLSGRVLNAPHAEEPKKIGFFKSIFGGK